MRIGLAVTVCLFFVAPTAVMARDVVQPPMLTVSPRPDWYVQRDEYKVVLGKAVDTAGDVNGDGYDDVIIASPTLTEAGRVYVYLGSAAGLTKSTIPSWTIERGDLFGYAVSTAGDVNGDGFDDVIIGGPFEDEDSAGRVYGFYGSPSGLSAATVPDWTAVNGANDSYFGYSVSTAGDVNGDGFDDVIVGAWRYDTDDADAGEARVYLGSANGLNAEPIWIAYGDRRLAEFGYSVSTAGDVNGDGYDDVIVGSPSGAVGGDELVYVFHGSPEGPSQTPDWVVKAANEDGFPSLFGRSVATAGDVNGDGFDDVIIGAAWTNFQVGAAYVYYGSPAGLSANPDWTGAGDDEKYAEQFGHSVGTAGDVNGDGFSDVIVGAIASGNFGGRAYVYLGSSAGLRVNPALRVKNSQANAEIGYSVGTAGDVNGDGLDDIIIGSPLFNDTQTDGGLAVVYYGRRPRVR